MIVLTAIVIGLAATPAMAAPQCATLASSITGSPGIKSASSVLVPAAGANLAFCQVNLLFGTNPNQNINIVIGLPLNDADGGTAGVQGAWNGRTEGLGGGGCAGNLIVNPAVNAGYVGSGTDLGHAGGNCEPGVNPDGTYNLQFIQDFIRNAIKQQVLWAKRITKVYYDMRPAYNYWNGCSTGGRQGYLLAQELPNELDGILANAPAIYWTRFQTAQMWGEIAMKDLTGAAIAPAKLAQARASAVAACDAADGVTDGVIDDPRTCHFSARRNVCGAPTAPGENCLTEAEASAVDKVWDGPRNSRHEKIWFGLDRGTDFSVLDGPAPFPLGVTQFHWDEHDLNFDWQTVSLSGYPQVAQDGSRNIADVTDTFGPLDGFKRHGGKLLTYVGANDQFIYPRGVLNYYRQMAARYGHNSRPDFRELNKFYRLFRAPGVGHCGIASTGPVPVDPFSALVNWVEHGVAPDSLLAAGGSAAPSTGRTRPVCVYPKTAIYNGSGSTDDAQNFHCGGNLETRDVVCADVLTRYKHEVHGGLDFSGSGVEFGHCRLNDFGDHHGNHF
ncbi:MAG TPA: tannase/feruloyl esterase family alpha/beta hydrolase [Terriglobales bacterium]